MKRDLQRYQEERDADHAALRMAVNLSGHLVLNAERNAAPKGDKGHGKEGKGKAHGKGHAKGKRQDK